MRFPVFHSLQCVGCGFCAALTVRTAEGRGAASTVLCSLTRCVRVRETGHCTSVLSYTFVSPQPAHCLSQLHTVRSAFTSHSPVKRSMNACVLVERSSISLMSSYHCSLHSHASTLTRAIGLYFAHTSLANYHVYDAVCLSVVTRYRRASTFLHLIISL